MVGGVLDHRLRRADGDLGHHRPAAGRHPPARPGGGQARPGAEPVGARGGADADLHRQLVGLVRVRDRLAAAHPGGRRQQPRATGRAARSTTSRRSGPTALWQWTWKMLDFHSHLLTPTDPAQRHPWESKPWSWPIGTRPVLYFSPANGTRLRRRPHRLRAADLPDRHPGAVVDLAVRAGLGAVEGRRPAGLAVRGRAGRLRRRLPALVHQSGPADVLLLRHPVGAVPGHRHHPGARRHPRPTPASGWNDA